MLCEIGKSELSVKMLLFYFFFIVCEFFFKAAVSVCPRVYTIYQTYPYIFKCFDHACNGVFISSIKNVSDMLLWLRCF